MTTQEFYEFQTTVEGTAVSFANQSDGPTIITCSDGVKLIVSENGDSRTLTEKDFFAMGGPIDVILAARGMEGILNEAEQCSLIAEA